MNVEGGDPLASAHQFFDEELFKEVVDPDVRLGGDEEEGLEWVEGHSLHLSVCFLEGGLGLPLGDC